MKTLWLGLVSCCIVVLCTLTAVAQIQNGQFTGTVTDPSGAAVPGARVTASNPSTNLSVTTITNGSGVYTIKELRPGTYKIRVEAKGFRSFEDSGVTLDVGAVQRVDAKLEIGQTKEVVEVSGAAALVNTETSQLSTTVTSTQIENLPLNGRNVYGQL